MSVGRDRTPNTSLTGALCELAAGFDGRLSVAAVNMRTQEEALLDADQVWGTASTIKLAILAELFRQVRAGQLLLSTRIALQRGDQVGGSGILKDVQPDLQLTLQDLATLMVVLSDNTATNMLISVVGGVAPVNACMRDYGLDSITLHRPVSFEHVGDDVRRLGEANARDLMRFAVLLGKEELVDAASSQQMLAILRRQQYLDQVPRFFDYNPFAVELGAKQELVVACKTGFFPGTRADVGLLSDAEGPLVAYCVMSQEATDRSMGVDNAGSVVVGLAGRLLLQAWWSGPVPPLQDLPNPAQRLLQTQASRSAI